MEIWYRIGIQDFAGLVQFVAAVSVIVYVMAKFMYGNWKA